MLFHRRVAAVVVALAVALPAAPAPAQPGPDPRPDQARAKKDVPAPGPAARDALVRALEQGRLTQAEYALERVRSAFDLRGVRREFGKVAAPDGRDVTMLFRDLALRLNELEGEDREFGEYLLARPDDPGLNDFPDDPEMPDGKIMKYGEAPSEHLCSDEAGICVHWVETGTHQADFDQANLTLDVLQEAWETVVEQGGFRPPKPDHKGPPGLQENYLDVYLANVGSVQPFPVYGYCTTDDPKVMNGTLGNDGFYDVSAYCVLDNDYSVQQFGGVPNDNLKVSAAHEYFHAVQFAYDYFGDWWLMEGTAVAIEDHVYDHIDDNYQFLLTSQFRQPHVPTDTFARRYGSWIFWRFMSEYLAEKGVPTLSVLLQIWRRADWSSSAGPGGRNYSLQAAVKVSQNNHGVPFRRLFVDYGVALQLPEHDARGFSEGPGYVQFFDERSVGRKTTHKAILLRPRAQRVTWQTKVNHLGQKYAAISKGKAVAQRRVRVILDLPPKKRGSMATLLRFAGNGNFLGMNRIKLDAQGNGRINVGPKARRVVVILTNASTRFRCGTGTLLSCFGTPRDNGLTFKVTARLLN